MEEKFEKLPVLKEGFDKLEKVAQQTEELTQNCF